MSWQRKAAKNQVRKAVRRAVIAVASLLMIGCTPAFVSVDYVTEKELKLHLSPIENALNALAQANNVQAEAIKKLQSKK